MLEPWKVLIIGASTRAAASSASRAGLVPRCLDQFIDADLSARHPVVRYDPARDGDDLERLASSLGFEAWFYTGSIEGRPDLVARLCSMGRLLGNPVDVLERVRNPWDVARVLKTAGFLTPALRHPELGTNAAGRWVSKSSVTAGGVGVAWEPTTTRRVEADHLQKFIEGPTFSALYLAARGEAEFVGVARQFRGPSEDEFLYRGGVGPWPPAGQEPELRDLGNTLARSYSLVGLFGVDFVLFDSRPHVLEINPRYTASVELFEAALGLDLIEHHVRACVDGRLPKFASTSNTGVVVGKRVLYADSPLSFPGLDLDTLDSGGRFGPPTVADVPAAGTAIEPGEPIMTLFASASSPDACLAELDRLEFRYRKWLAETP